MHHYIQMIISTWSANEQLMQVNKLIYKLIQFTGLVLCLLQTQLFDDEKFFPRFNSKQ